MRPLVSMVCCWILVTLSLAQDVAVKDIRLLGRLEDALLSWFDDLSRSADQIADKEDQKKTEDFTHQATDYNSSHKYPTQTSLRSRAAGVMDAD
jgi:hypothetical protein